MTSDRYTLAKDGNGDTMPRILPVPGTRLADLHERIGYASASQRHNGGLNQSALKKLIDELNKSDDSRASRR